MPEFSMTFAPKMFFPEISGGTCPFSPPSPTHAYEQTNFSATFQLALHAPNWLYPDHITAPGFLSRFRRL